LSNEVIHVILCSYQGEKFIEEQLNSILTQTYTNVKIHIFDDCSTDMTPSIIESYSKLYNNVTYHINDENLGFVENFEHALTKVDGKYIALADQDDIWHPDKLTISMEELKKIERADLDKPILIHSDLTLANTTGQRVESSFFLKKGLSLTKKKSLGKILGHCGVMGNTILMNKALVDMATPFPKGLKYHDYWLSVINECFGTRSTITKPLINYRIHDTNTSNNNYSDKTTTTLPFMQDDRAKAIKYLLDNYDLEKEDRKLISRYYSYLCFDDGGFSHYTFLLKNDFFKQSIFYRINALLRILFSKEFGHDK
jgi:rhamnosyltransferase